jgi:hypothetical protein
MTTHDRGDPAGPGPDPAPSGRVANGLRALVYVPLTDVEPSVGQYLLAALERARIAAYLDGSTGSAGAAGSTPAPVPGVAAGQRRLFVAAEERGDARTIVAAAVRALGTEPPQLPEPDEDPLAGVDTDAVFEQIVADWHVDTHHAIRAAERDLNREDAEWRARLAQPPAEDPIWLDDDHYVPPPPPPLPRLSAPTVLAILVLVLAILVLALGNSLGLPGNFGVILGVGGLLVGVGILLSRVRVTRDDEDDDGAAV